MPSVELTDTTDRDLIVAISQGDTGALETLYQRYWRILLIYLIGRLDDRMLAEEVLQDVMFAIWQGASGFRGESSVRTWVFAIARRQATQAWQRSKPEEVVIEDRIPCSNPTPPEALEQRTSISNVQTAIGQLPKHQREVLELVFYCELSGPEVAQVMGITLGTVKSRLRRAKDMLHKLLRFQEHDNA